MNSTGFSVDLCRSSFSSLINGLKIKKKNRLEFQKVQNLVFSVFAYQDLALLLTSGSLCPRTRKTVMRCTIMNDKWDIKLPSMNEERDSHGSCALSDRLYVFDGLK